ELSLLNKGLTFCPNTRMPNAYQVEVDLLRFERNLLLKDHFYQTNNLSEESTANNTCRSINDICKRKSTFFPTHKTLEIKNFITNVRKDALHELNNRPSNYKCNITRYEKRALDALINDDTIQIKPADKGGAIV